MAIEAIRRVFQENLRWFFKPVAKFAIRHGLSRHDLHEGLKQALVDESIQELERIGGLKSASRVALMTGVHRRDITRIINSTDTTPVKEGSIMSRILARWQTDPEFQNDLGEPRVLSTTGKDHDFEQLVFSISRELNPMTIAKELERLNLVKFTKQGLKLVFGLYIPKGSIKDALNILSNDTSDLWDSIQENVFEKPELPNHHIRTEYDSIPDELLPKVRQWLLEEGTNYHARVRKFLSECDKDLNKSLAGKPGNNRVSMISFSFVDDASVNDKNVSRTETQKKKRTK